MNGSYDLHNDDMCIQDFDTNWFTR